MLKKLLALLLLLLSLTAAAQAQSSRPTGGSIQMAPPEESEGLVSKDTFRHVTVEGDLTTGSDVTFTVKGAKEGVTYEMMLGIEVDWTYYFQCVYYTGEGPTSFTYHFSMPGTYLITVYSSDLAYGFSDCFEVTGEDLAAQKVSQIVAQCTGTTDYEKALWLHDWLMTNTYYDATLTYHGADYLLLNGWGVCQSYSEAYRKLCRAAGVPCEIVTASGMGHEWNEIQIGGAWYEVDVTWDTSGYASYGQGKPSS